MVASKTTGKEIMNRGLLVNRVHERVRPLGVTKKDAEAVCRALFIEIAEGLGAGYDISIQGFGSFRAKEVPAREVKNNLQGGGMVTVPARTRVMFKASGALKEAAEGGE